MPISYFTRFLDQSFEWAITSGVRIVLILGAMLVMLALLKRGVTKLSRLYRGTLPIRAQIKRVDTLTHIVRDVARIVILFVGMTMILSEGGVDLKPLLAAAGLGGLAIGFGAQSLVKDLISGFFILWEDSVRIGDVVEVAGVAGLVEEVELRTIKLRDVSGNLHVVPNGVIEKVKNLTKDYSYSVFDIGVAYRENVDEVMRELQATAEDVRRDSRFADDILEPLEMLGVDQFKDSAVMIKCRIKTEPHKQWRVGREMNRRIKNMFDAKGIEIPFPYQPSYWGEPKKGAPQPT
ncbi:MAG TPA: mechanosensitive ion channel family protein [Nitrospiraceae bacterium]|jgi:small-conductance mechanosensitive channel|nr:mechanosensitive ion channel family protein [Nitrospiraceae bacterium]